MPGGLRVVAMALAGAVLSPAPVRASTATVGTAPARAAGYTAVTAGDISPAVAGDPERVYVPDSGGGAGGRADPPPRPPVLGPQVPVRRQRRLQLAHGDRPENGEAGRDGARRPPLQPL